jgi:hypothetical protein
MTAVLNSKKMGVLRLRSSAPRNRHAPPVLCDPLVGQLPSGIPGLFEQPLGQQLLERGEHLNIEQGFGDWAFVHDQRGVGHVGVERRPRLKLRQWRAVGEQWGTAFDNGRVDGRQFLRDLGSLRGNRERRWPFGLQCLERRPQLRHRELGYLCLVEFDQLLER